MASDRKVMAGFKDEAEKSEAEHEAIQRMIGKTQEYMETQTKIQITVSALIQRLNRNLMGALRQLRKSRGSHTRITLGDYCMPDINHNFVVMAHTTVERMEEIARQLGLLQKWEEVEK